MLTIGIDKPITQEATKGEGNKKHLISKRNQVLFRASPGGNRTHIEGTGNLCPIH